MVENNVELIRRILSGDDEAFRILVKSHQKSVHALVWKKIGDFHIAEEITQDTFIRVYKKLATLEDPNRFEGWLYVIANRLCINWIQRNKVKMDRLNMQSLENTPAEEVEESSYVHHMSEQRETEAGEHRQAMVRKLLGKLPESERTVVTLYYLGEMTAKEIGKFLGVSVNTIKSRLRRARERLQEEELAIQETLKGIQLSDNLIENVMRQVADLQPTPPPIKKPLLPWAAFGTAAVLVMLLIGVGSQYLPRFQQPYSFEAQSEPTIEIIDAAITIDIVAKPSVRSRLGHTATRSENDGAGMRVSETALSTNTLDDSANFSTSQWIPIGAPKGGPVATIFATSEKTLYATTPIGIYRLAADASTWMPINTGIPTGASRMPMAEYADILYIVSADKIFASNDKGETWNVLGLRPRGKVVEIIVMDGANERNSETHPVMYLALEDKGVFRSTDACQQWTPLDSGLTDRVIYAFDAIGKRLFAGTDRGLYRFDSGSWRQLPVDTSRVVYSLVVMKNRLYAGTGPDLSDERPGASSLKRIFHSPDLGESWTEITSVNNFSSMKIPSGIKIVAAGETLLALGATELHSKDGGETWMHLRFDYKSLMETRFPVVAVDENTFYRARRSGLYRTIDGGESWHPFMDGIAGANMWDLVRVNNRLYAHTGSDIVQSTDGGATWESVRFNSSDNHLFKPSPSFYGDSKLAVNDNVLYVISLEENSPRVFRASVDGNVLLPIQGIPIFKLDVALTKPQTQQVVSVASEEKEDRLYFMRKHSKIRKFAVSGETFYVEYDGKLLKWNFSTPEWIAMELGDDKQPDVGLTFAVSAETLYVGSLEGKLFQSLDGGDTWKDLTSSLPLRFASFKEIVFAGSTVCVATDEGVLISEDGKYWRVVTDKAGEHIIINKFAVNGAAIYGAGDSGVYCLEGEWKQVFSQVPDAVQSFVINSNRLYIATYQSGMFHTLLEDDKVAKRHFTGDSTR